MLTPGRYVGAAAEEDDGEPFEEKMARLTAQLEEQFAESAAARGRDSDKPQVVDVRKIELQALNDVARRLTARVPIKRRISSWCGEHDHSGSLGCRQGVHGRHER